MKDQTRSESSELTEDKDITVSPSAVRSIKIVESAEFTRNIDLHLSEIELDALRRLLVDKPFTGSPIDEHPGLLVIKWGKDASTHIVYAVGKELDVIFLIAVYSGDADTTSKDEKKQIASFLKDLLRPVSFYQ